MTAGLYVRFRIWRMVNMADDATGGARVTENIAYDNVHGSIAETSQTILMGQQGYEMPSVFNVQVKIPHGDINERDELEVILPTQHALYGERLRITGIHLLPYGALDRRNYVHMSVTRKEFAHKEQ